VWAVWAVIPLLIVSMMGVQESFAEDYSYNWGKYHLYDKNTIIDSPKVQFENGIEPHEILCNNGLYLIYKTLDGSPVCVKEYFSAPKLIERGWGTLGETLLVITTDKEVYSVGEKITITMKNEGDTSLIFNSSPDFYIRDNAQNHIEMPLDTISPPFDRIVSFDTLASTTFVWNQTDRNLIPVNPGTYSVYSTYMKPLPSNDSTQLSHEWLETIKTFEIIANE